MIVLITEEERLAHLEELAQREATREAQRASEHSKLTQVGQYSLTIIWRR